ncbi:MAG: GntR family transcriptional regulator [Burkholderiaceae bacterium]|nr:GntR family transcriptional regulator [Microbacteriaceae bacterium]
MAEPEDSASRADRAAGDIRSLLISGGLVPGQRLSETALGETLGVSRNTLREAFRELTSERLLTRRPHAGVFVAVPGLSSIIDIYRVRRIVEGQALGTASPGHPAGARMHTAVESAADSAAAGDWVAVGTANMEFHSAIVALADSVRLDRLYANISAELRLAFGLLDDPEYLHRPYVERNTHVLGLYDGGDSAGAAAALDAYLVHSERTVLAAYSRRIPR